MADIVSSADQRMERWRAILHEAQQNRESPVIAETFLYRWGSFSRPVALGCNDGNEYVVKGRHAGRGIVNDHLIAHLGIALGAPVGQPRIVVIPTELQQIEPQLADITAGTAHGTLLIPNCSDKLWLAHTDSPENRERFALLAVLYGWCHAGDRQLIYPNEPPHLVYSVDHGHFFLNGPEWRIENLAQTSPAQLYDEIVSGCQLTGQELHNALLALKRIAETAIVRAVAAPPDEWGLSLEERIALIEYFVRRREEMLPLLTSFV